MGTKEETALRVSSRPQAEKDQTPLVQIRRSFDRGTTRTDWLKSQHSFSFGDYHDAAHMGFGVLRVINEDTVAPGGGFETHGHRDMEIITYVLSGALAHKDSLGNGSTIRPGDVQRMSAGRGIRHSEFNASDVAPVHFLQIWITPDKKGIEPGYAQQSFTESRKPGVMQLVASASGREGSISIQQDANVYVLEMKPEQRVDLALKPDRLAWVQVARGQVTLNGEPMDKGDGAGIARLAHLTLEAVSAAELLLFDLPPR